MSGYVKSLKITSIENQLDSHNNNKRKTDKTIGYRIILICYVIIMRCKKRYNNEDIRDMRLPINRPGDRSLSRRNIQQYNLKCYKK